MIAYEVRLCSDKTPREVYYSQDGARDAAARLSRAEGGRWVVERREADRSRTTGRRTGPSPAPTAEAPARVVGALDASA